GAELRFAHQLGLKPDRIGAIKWLLLNRPFDDRQFFQFSKNSFKQMLVESRSNFADIFQFIPVGLGQMEGAEGFLAIAFAARITDDGALDGLAGLNFEP